MLLNDRTLKTIYIGCNGIGDKGGIVISALLFAKWNDIAGAHSLAEAVKVNNNVEGLWLKRNSITIQGVRDLCAALRSNSSVTTLDLVHFSQRLYSFSVQVQNNLGVEGITELANMLEVNRSIKHLYCSGNKLGPRGIEILCETLKKGTVIESLYCGVNEVTQLLHSA